MNIFILKIYLKRKALIRKVKEIFLFMISELDTLSRIAGKSSNPDSKLAAYSLNSYFHQESEKCPFLATAELPPHMIIIAS